MSYYKALQIINKMYVGGIAQLEKDADMLHKHDSYETNTLNDFVLNKFVTFVEQNRYYPQNERHPNENNFAEDVYDHILIGADDCMIYLLYTFMKILTDDNDHTKYNDLTNKHFVSNTNFVKNFIDEFNF
jgi:hypothetical protein